MHWPVTWTDTRVGLIVKNVDIQQAHHVGWSLTHITVKLFYAQAGDSLTGQDKTHSYNYYCDHIKKNKENWSVLNPEEFTISNINVHEVSSPVRHLVRSHFSLMPFNPHYSSQVNLDFHLNSCYQLKCRFLTTASLIIAW